MFEFQKQKTALMIVCDEKLMEYANYLMALIGQNDDNDGKVVGTKDGTVSAVIYTLQAYRDTLPKLTSDTHILFLGSFKEAKEVGENIVFQFNLHGMHFGWIGKRAVMFVKENVLTIREYKELMSYSKAVKGEYLGATCATRHKNLDIEYLLEAILPQYIFNFIANFFPVQKKKLRKQQYRTLTLAVYYYYLQKFLEG